MKTASGQRRAAVDGAAKRQGIGIGHAGVRRKAKGQTRHSYAARRENLREVSGGRVPFHVGRDRYENLLDPLGGETFADNRNYMTLPRFRVELMLAEADPELQARFEEALGSIGPFTSNEGWIPGENAYQLVYELTWHPHRDNQ